MARKIPLLFVGLVGAVLVVAAATADQKVDATNPPPLPTVTPAPTLELSPMPNPAQQQTKYYEYSRTDWGANPAWDSRLEIRAPYAYATTSIDEDAGKSYRIQVKAGQLISLPDPAQTPTGIVVHDTQTANLVGAACTVANSEKTIRELQQYDALHFFGRITYGPGKPDPRKELDNRGLLDSSSGDLTYHFFVDCAGKIYEGRAGGIYREAQSVHRHNAGLVAIALMGSFEKQPPPVAQVAGLVKLTTALCRNLDIDPTAQRLEPLLDGTLKPLSKNGRPVLNVDGHAVYPDNNHTDPGKLDLDSVRRQIKAALGN